MKRATPHTPQTLYWEAGGEAPAPTPASGEVRGPTVGRARALSPKPTQRKHDLCIKSVLTAKSQLDPR